MPFYCQRCLPTLWSQIRLFLRKQNKQNERREERLHFKHLHYLNTLHLLRSCLKSLCAACMHTKSLQLCLTLCNPMDHSLLGSSVHGFSRQEYWSGLPFPSPGHLSNPGIKPVSLLSPALAAGSLPLGNPLNSLYNSLKKRKWRTKFLNCVTFEQKALQFKAWP